jgi:hypothetical protein
MLKITFYYKFSENKSVIPFIKKENKSAIFETVLNIDAFTYLAKNINFPKNNKKRRPSYKFFIEQKTKLLFLMLTLSSYLSIV